VRRSFTWNASMSRSGLMTLDPIVSLRSGHAADARTSNREGSASGIRHHADPLNSTTWPSSPGRGMIGTFISAGTWRHLRMSGPLHESLPLE
jgi:hypothetical protein